MKRLLFLLIIFCAIKVNAQNYLISFIGSGASTTVSTVKVDNLTAGTSLTLNGNDLLRLTGTTGVNSIENKQSSELKIYPNPMNDNSTLEIYPPVTGDAIITVYDITGKLVTQIHSYLENCKQEFCLSGINNGLYLISVKSKTYQFSGKLLCNGKSNGTISIEKISNNIQAVDEKTAKMDFKGAQATVDMAYTTGDRIKFTGISGIYSTVKMDIPAGDKTITFNFIACTDGDNNNYPVVEIGSQIWMAENLKSTRYNDNTAIPNVPDNTAWINLSTPGYCWYQNDTTYKATYGAIYNWYTINTGKLCPTSWHVSTDGEYNSLELYLGIPLAQVDLLGWRGTDQGAQMKNTTGWDAGGNGTNTIGFSALPGGYRYGATGDSWNLGIMSYWWSSTEYDADIAWYRRLDGSNNGIYKSSTSKKAGKYMRCVKD